MKLVKSLRWLAVAALTCSLPAVAAEPYDIDVVLPLTGPAAFLGKAEQISLQQAEKMLAKTDGIGGRPVKFVFHDDQSSPQAAVQLATQIVTTRPAVVLGSGIVAMCNAMAPLMKDGPVMYCFSPGVYPPPGSYVFSSSVATRDLIAAQIRYFRLMGWTKLAVITSTDASGQDAAKNIKAALALPENKDVQLVIETSFNPGDVSASAQIQRIKGAQPQALIAWSTGAGIGTVFKSIAEAGLSVPVATTNGNMTYAQMQQYAGFLPKALYTPSSEWLPGAAKGSPAAQIEANRQFHGAFEGSGTKPDAASSFAWDPAMLVISGLRKLEPGATAAQLREYLAGLQGYAGVNGVYDFKKVPQRGLDDSSVYITLWSPAKTTWEVVSESRGVPLK